MIEDEEFLGMECYLPIEISNQIRDNIGEFEYVENGIKYHKMVPLYTEPVENSNKDNSKNKK